MKRNSLLIAAAITASGCKMSEDAFVEQYADAYCTWVEGCGKLAEQFGTLDDCVTNRTVFAEAELTPSGCDYSPKAAKECITRIGDNESCDINSAMPESCTEVSSCFGDTGR